MQASIQGYGQTQRTSYVGQNIAAIGSAMTQKSI